MKKLSIRQVLQYVFFLAVAVALFYLVVKNIDWNEFNARLNDVNYLWVVVSILCALLSHWARAHRWTLMLKPLGHQLAVYPTFLAVMIGYVSNLLLPRFGEVARCGVLSKKQAVPLPQALGSVLAERALDLVIMLLVVGAALFLEFPRLKGFLEELFADGTKFDDSAFLLIVGLALVSVPISIYVFYRIWHPKLKSKSWYAKFLSLLTDVKDGLLSIGRVKEQGWFWFDTIFIWVMYYVMTYVIVFTLPQTSGISLLAGLSILAMGSIGMAAPVQGGIGTYHFLVTGTLLAYGASKTDAAFLAILLHASQTLMVVVVGLIAFYLSLRLPTRTPSVAPPAPDTLSDR